MISQTENGSAPDRIPLGKTDVHVPLLGTGTLAWRYSHLWGGTCSGYREEDCRGAFQASLSAGIDFFDTAEIYARGQSERLLGLFRQESGREIVIATKFMPWPWRLTRASLLDALRMSLARLGISRVDLYQLHWPLPPVSIESWMDAMADAVEAGLVRAVGVSNCNVSQMWRASETLARRGLPLASNQVEFSLLDRGPRRQALLKACNELGVTFIAYSPLGTGLLTGKYRPGKPPSGIRRLRYAHRLGRMQPLLSLMRRIGEAHSGKTPAQVALNWVMCKGAVPIPGAKNAQQATENAGALGWRLTDDEVAALDEASEGV